MKIAVYAIAKNEEQFVERFYESCKNADLILIADTGSTDGTIEKAKSLGIEVHSISVTPWRFDTARNMALDLLPDDVDVCVSLDLDEVLVPTWREDLEKAWEPGTQRLSYLWEDGPKNYSVTNKTHARHGYAWHYPCHEMPFLKDAGTDNEKLRDEKIAKLGVFIQHFPDRSKSRAQYFDLIKQGTIDEPEDFWLSVLYTRELFVKKHWEQAIAEGERSLLLNSNNHIDGAAIRSFVMRLIGKCLTGLDKNEEALEWFRKAVIECPGRREVWVDMAKICHNLQKWEDCYEAAMQATLAVHNQYLFPYSPEAWGPIAYDLAAVSCYKLGRYKAAVHAGKLALARDPENERLQRNVEGYEETLKEAMAAGAA